MVDFFNIKAQTIQLQKPGFTGNNEIKRVAVVKNIKTETLIAYEAFLRRLAYKNTIIKTSESFFNDSDMQSGYFLIVVYNKKTTTPLLSARYYFARSAIEKCLKGDLNIEPAVNGLDLEKIKEDKLFLCDRLSGNISCPVYRYYRGYIFLLFYWQVLIKNRQCKFIVMARKEKYEKLLKKYLQLGLNTIGSIMHKGVEHWILLGDVEHCYKQLKMPFLFYVILKVKMMIHKLKTF